MGEENRPEGAGDGPEQLAGATGVTGTGCEVGAEAPTGGAGAASVGEQIGAARGAARSVKGL